MDNNNKGIFKIKENSRFIYPVLMANTIFFLFSWWRCYAIFYIFCGDSDFRWKVFISIYFLLLILIGYFIGHLLNKLLKNNIKLISIFMPLTIILTIVNLYRLIKFLLFGVY